MVSACCAFGCSERQVKGGPISFHSFPKDENRRKLWERNIRREGFKATDRKRQCYQSQLEKRREASGIGILEETDEQREKKRSDDRTDAAKSRAQSRDLVTRQCPVEMCQELYETIRNYKTEGRLLCKSFIRAPNRWSLAEYYDIVTSPIDLLKIQQKLKTKEYINVQQFASDVELLVTNAKSYYKESSQEYQDACELWKVFSDEKIRKEEDMTSKINDTPTLKKGKNIKKRKCSQVKSLRNKGQKGSSFLVKVKEEYSDLIDEEHESEPEDSQSNPQWLLYETVMTFANSQGYQLSKLFWMLPDRRSYPDYYSEVKHPIALSTIKTKIEQCQYSRLVDVVADMKLMFKYAKMYNAASSKYFKGAVQLEEVMQARAKELLNIYMNWRQPSNPRKMNYEELVQMPKKEIHARLLSISPAGSTQGILLSDRNENLRYECLWDNCDRKFEKRCDLIDHLAKYPTGHVRQTVKNKGPDELECLWYNCPRKMRYVLPLPFPTVPRLIRHVKEVHLKTFRKTNLRGHQMRNEKLADYNFEGKCKKCNFSDMKVCAKTTNGCNVGLVLKCTLCPTTKVIGMDDPSIKGTCPKSQDPLLDFPPSDTIKQELILPDNGTSPSIEGTCPKSQDPLLDFPQVATIKQELILPDDGTNPLINSSSEPTRVEMMVCENQDQSRIESKSVTSDTCTSMDMTNSINATPVAHTQTSLQRPIRKFYKQYSHVRKTSTSNPDDDTSAGHLLPHSKRQIAVKMRELPNYPNRLLIRKKTLPQQTPFNGQLRVQPDVNQQVSAITQSQHVIKNRVQVGQSQGPSISKTQPVTQLQSSPIGQSQAYVVPLIDLPQVASIKQELILPDDGTNLSFINSSLEPTSKDQGKSSTKLGSVPSDSHTAMDVTATHGVAPTDALPVDLNLVKKEVDDETPCH